MSSLQGKILVIRGGAIGDFILTLPAIAALRKQFPQAHLEVLGYPHIVQLAQAGGLVDKISSIEARALAGFFARHGELAEDLVNYFSEFDLILSYLYDPDEIFRTNIGRCSPAQFIACPHKPDERTQVPAAVAYLKPLERLAIFEADPVPTLHIETGNSSSSQSAAGAEQGNRPAPRLALHPGSGGDRKNWPEQNWAELLQRLVNSTPFDLLLVGGEAEGERLPRLAAALPPVRTRVAQSLPLAELARLLGRCHGFVGHDSGISHLAAALGLPGLILWGATNEIVWRPPSRKVTVLRHPAGLDKLPAKRVFDEIHRLWPLVEMCPTPGKVPPSRIGAAIFDMDGVLTDSEPLINSAAIAMFAEHGLVVRPEDFRPFIGTGEDRYIGGVAEHYGFALDLPSAKRRTYEIYLELVPQHLHVFPGAVELVKSCRAAGLRVAVASSADRIKVDANLTKIGLPVVSWDALVTGEDVVAKKPAPDIFLKAAEKLGMRPAQCVVIEDAVNGIEAARAAGMRCVAVAQSFGPERLRAADAVRAKISEVSIADLAGEGSSGSMS